MTQSALRLVAKEDGDKQRALDWYEHLRIVYALETAALQFKEKEGRFPASLNELRTAGYVETIPDSPVRRIWDYNSETGRVSFERIKE